MTKLSPQLVLVAMKVVFAALSLLVEEMSRKLIKQKLIPDQLDIIGDVGALFILIALLCTLVFWSRIDRYLSVIMIMTVVALILITLIQVNYVVRANVGAPTTPGGQAPEHRFLIGYSLTEGGAKNRIENCGPNLDEKSYIECAGYTDIPLWYGTSYKVMTTAYTLMYLTFMVGVVFVLGGILKRAGNKAVEKLGST